MSTSPAIASPPADYVTDKGPGLGRRSPARSWLASDAPRLSLDGEWSFRLLPGVPGAPGSAGVLPEGEAPAAFAAPAYDDGDWGTIPVPAHWVLTGDGTRGGPIYTNVQFPFPTEPPFVPDENPTGDYRRSFTLPDAFEAMDAVLLRFDGVESRYAVWVNGAFVGVGVGSRLAQEFDVSGLLAPGENVIAVRVHQWSASSYLEDQDEWWLPGIFRSVTLEGRPAGGIEDVWLQTPFHGEAGAAASGTIVPEITARAGAFPLTLSVPELGISETWASAQEVRPIDVAAVEPWSAEQPRLYDAELSSTGETVTLRLGFRTVRIEGDSFLINGRRVVFHGMNRPEINPELGRVFDEEYVRRDLEKMKRFNVNAIRTAHYPPHPRVLELCDELGFWVILENDLETHGFDRDGWAENPSDDPSWGEAYLDRMVRTVERDKNHPAVIMWSLGNEAHTGRNLAAMAAWTHRRDPGRPVHYEGDYTGVYTDVYSRMYPWVEEVEAIGSGDAAFRLLGTTESEAARQRAKPFLLCEYVHAMGNGPGAIDDYERLVDLYPRLHGGFVWEWRDHGLRTRTADGVEYFAYGGDFGEVVHDGNFLMDGIVLSDGTPSPALHEWAQVVAPIRLLLERDEAGAVTVVVENRRHSADASDIELRYEVTHDGRPRQDGRIALAGLADGAPGAGAQAAIALPELEIADSGESWLTVEAVLAADAGWAPAGHRVSARQLDLTPRAALLPRPSARAAVVAADAVSAVAAADAAEVSGDAPARLELGPASFRDGRLVALAGKPVVGPQLELWRAPTDNDRGQWDAPLDHEGGAGRRPGRDDLQLRGVYLSSEALWRREGLDRLVGRVESVRTTPSSVQRRTRYAPANSRRAVTVTEHWELAGDDVLLSLELVPTAGWETSWPRLGVRFELPLEVDAVSWFGTGPRESYPDSTHAALVGRYSSSVDELTIDYGRPQESGHRSAVRELDLTTSGQAPWLHVDALRDALGRLPGFSLRRHTAQEVDAAAHSFELPAPAATYLWLDAAQHGLGSRACGPDVAARYANRPEARTLRFVFRAAA
jgi:beta-galactosidase